ncbi:3785_t:CDS:2 [Dentiscutata erythropus]|uniref:3785_t:CDS:1 n=1 Tax=Dentiscutata erythropus TaxID=1348616 RepID=A0A9N9E3N1_9GLOM|nr:3785_t:CDS:2 [Dentiscutata erythropus]
MRLDLISDEDSLKKLSINRGSFEKIDDQDDYRPDSPEQKICASNSSNYSLQEFSIGFHKKKHRKCFNFSPKFHSSKHLYGRSRSDSSQQECTSSSSNYSQESDNGSHEGKRSGPTSLQKSGNKRHKSSSHHSIPKWDQNAQAKVPQSGTNYYSPMAPSSEECHHQIDEQLFRQNKQIYLILLKNSDDINELKNELKQQKAKQENEFLPRALDHDFEKNDALSQESVKIIAAEETGENENIDTTITIETQEQTIMENILNSRKINDELFGVNFD